MLGEEVWGSSQRCSEEVKSGLGAGNSSCSTPNLANRVFTVLALCTGAGMGLGRSVSGKGNCNITAHGDILYRCALPTM